MSGVRRPRIVSVNDRGLTIGQDHHRAKLTDHDIDLIRELRAQGMKLSDLAEKFETSKGYVHDVCSQRRGVRAHTAMDQRTRAHPRLRFRPAHPREFAYVTDADAE